MLKNKKPLSKAKRASARREFLRSSALTVGVVGISLAGLYPIIAGSNARLRPPGALKNLLDEQELFAACIKCGQCVQVCPVNAIKLAELDEGVGIGVPYIDAREQACDFSCDGLQCVLACPTGALTHDLNYPADTRMGFARLAKPGSCLAIQGKGFKGVARGADYKGLLRYDEIDRWNPIPVADHPYDVEICDLCVRQCPIEIRITQCVAKDKQREQAKQAGTLARVAEQHGNECPPKHAIELRPIENAAGLMQMRPVVLDGCVGCGVCEMICPVEKEPAIVIDINKVTNWS
ncbi:MAG: 4Fe-4S dicluster domain-containing protein [Gammaproteobacteria bacterium]|nr:4Fe-4S dicluster domain-containing protein [Gammaproteobacteria bacterium]